MMPVTSHPLYTIAAGGGGWGHRAKVGPGRWVPADPFDGGWIAWDCDPRPTKHQPAKVLESVTVAAWPDGRPLTIVTRAELGEVPNRATTATLPVPAGAMVRATDPPSSRAAAKRAADPAHLTASQELALFAHYACENVQDGGLTDFELAAETNRQQTSIGKRRGELERAGLVEFTGSHRPAPSGSAARVYRITAAGYTLAGELARLAELRRGETP